MKVRFLVIPVLIILAEVYSFILVRSSVRHLPRTWKVGLFGAYLLVTLITWCSILFFRKIDWSHLPHMARNIFVAFTIGFFVGKLLILAIMLLDDIRRIFLWILFKIAPASQEPLTGSVEGISRSGFLKATALILGGLSISGFLYGVTNRYNYQLKRVRLSFPGLPKAFRGLKIVQLSDIHSGSFDQKEAVERGIEKTMAERPDIIFFTGDLVNNKADEVLPYLSVFSRLKAPLGVYSTLGNHDYGDYVQWDSAEAKRANLQKLKELQASMGWRMLNNEHVILEREGEKIAVIGVENWSAKLNFPRYGDLHKACRGLENQDVPFKLLLSHDPSHFDAQITPSFKDIDLTLSGHTHGMQFGVEIPGFKWSPVQYMYHKWAGLYQVGKQFLYVNRGFGFLGYAGRIGILPEITVIELT